MEVKVYFTEWMIKSLKRYPHFREKIQDAVICIFARTTDGRFSKLKDKDTFYKYKLSKSFRVIIKKSRKKGVITYIFLDMGPHDIYKRLNKKGFLSFDADPERDDGIIKIDNIDDEIFRQPVDKDLEEEYGEKLLGIKLFEVKENHLNSFETFQKFLDGGYNKYLDLHEEQLKVLYDMHSPCKIIRGKAGTGKTIVLFHHLLQDIDHFPSTPKMVITYSPCVSFIFRRLIKSIFDKDPEELNVYIYSFDAFLRNYVKNAILDEYRKLRPAEKDSIEYEKWLKDIQLLESKLNTENLIDDFASFQMVEEIVARNSETASENPEIIWSVIKNIAFGTLLDAPLVDKMSHLSLKGEIVRKAPLFEFVSREYQRRLRRNNYIDLGQFYKNLYEVLQKFKGFYDSLLVYVDEIQDFSELQRRILFEICRKAKDTKLFLTYDMNQKINVTGFNAKLLRNELLELFKAKNAKDLSFIRREHQLTHNFRCSKEISDFAHFLNPRKRNEALLSTGVKPKIIKVDNIKAAVQLLESIKKNYGIMFVGFKSFLEYEDIFDENIIYFRYSEVKGLENDIVVLIDPFSVIGDYDYEKILYMTATRARRYLYLVTTEKSYRWFRNRYSVDKLKKLAEFVAPEDIVSEISSLTKNTEDPYTQTLYASSMANYIIKLYNQQGMAVLGKFRQKLPLIEERLLELGGYEFLEKVYRETDNKERLAYLYAHWMNRFDEAISLYISIGKFEEAGDLYKDKLQNYIQAKALYKKAKAWHKYVLACELNGDFEEAGDVYLNILGNPEKAKINYSKAQAWEKVGDVYLKEGNFQKAEEMYKKANALEKLGDIYLNLKEYSRAKKIYRKAKAWGKYAQVCALTNDFKEAGDIYMSKLQLFQKAKEMYHKAKAWKKFAIACELNNNFEEAGDTYMQKLHNYEKAKELYHKAKAWEKLGDVYFYLSDFEKAKEFYEKVNAWEKLGNVHFHLGDLDRARELYHKARAWKKFAIACELNNNFEEAGDTYMQKLHNYEKAKELYHKAKAWEKYALACELKGDLEEAGDVYLEKLHDAQKAKELYKKAKAWRKYAIACETNNEFEKAGDIFAKKLHNYDKAKELYHKAKTWKKFAIACELNGDLEEAGDIYMQKLRNYERAKELYYKAKAWKKFAIACELNGDLEEAGDIYMQKLRNYEKTKELYKKAEVWKKYALACELNGDLEEAGDTYMEILHNYEKAKEMYEKAGTWKKLGDVYFHLRDFKKAKEIYGKAQALEKYALACELNGDLEEAGDTYMEILHNYEKAKEMYYKAKAWKKFAIACELNNNFEEAGDTYMQKLHNYEKAKELYQKAQAWEKLGDIYLRFHKFGKAKEMFKKALAWKKYAIACEINHEFEEAGDIYKNKLLDYAKAKSMYEKLEIIAKLQTADVRLALSTMLGIKKIKITTRESEIIQKYLSILQKLSEDEYRKYKKKFEKFFVISD